MIRLFVANLLLTSVYCAFPNFYPKLHVDQVPPPTTDPGEPLYLTPLLKSGNISAALELSEVPKNFWKDVKSYAGYFTVNEKYNSNLFFWYFPPLTNGTDDTPVIVWLQGGPGASSLFGLFMENGPFYITKAKKGGATRSREHTWNKQAHVIYIDNPVGTGWSFTDAKEGYSTNQIQVGENLYNALQQFFQLFPALLKNPFFVTGESYAGKYVPALSYTIHTKNQNAVKKINLQGLAIGNGFTDPINQLGYSDYLYQLGLIDSNGQAIFRAQENKARLLIKNQKYSDAYDLLDKLIDGDSTNGKSIFSDLTKFHFYFNYLYHKDYQNVAWADRIQRNYLRKTIHVGNNTFHSENLDVEGYLKGEIMQSVAPWVSVLLSGYRVLIYNGQLDIIVAYPLTENYLKQLSFNAANQYKTASRCAWMVDDELAGYVKQAGKLTEVLVRNAGHMVPTDQPKWALDLINKFTTNKILC